MAGAAGVGGCDVAVGAGGPTGWPQLKQNFASGASFVPQFTHARESELPQFEQNFAPSGFTAPQLAQFITAGSLIYDPFTVYNQRLLACWSSPSNSQNPATVI